MDQDLKPPNHLTVGDIIEHNDELMEFKEIFQGNLIFESASGEQAFLPEDLPSEVEVLFNCQ